MTQMLNSLYGPTDETHLRLRESSSFGLGKFEIVTPHKMAVVTQRPKFSVHGPAPEGLREER